MPRIALLLAAASFVGCVSSPLPAQQPLPDQAYLEATLKRKALLIADEGILHFYSWRRGLDAEWQGRPVEIFEGTALRVSFQKHGDECLVSGQLTLVADEVVPVVAGLAEGGLRVASLVPRFPGSTPALYELRFFGEGSEQDFAPAVAEAFTRIVPPLATTGRGANPANASATTTTPPKVPEKSSPVTRSAAGPSRIHEGPLEHIFGCKAEVKDGVALFRFEGSKGLLGGKPTSRMGAAVFAGFAGSDDAARVRLDWTVERRDLAALLRKFGAAGFEIESIVAAAPAMDDELLQVVMVGAGKAVELARLVAGDLAQRRDARLAFERPFVAPANAVEVLGVGGDTLAAGWVSGATHPSGPQRAAWGLQKAPEPAAMMTDPGQWSGRTFNLLWNPTIRFRDGKLTLRMRADQGRVDQGGGLIWRAKDENNYYVTRFNPLEQDFRVYHVVDGVRTQIKAFGQLPYRSQDWFTIEVEQRGNTIRCVLNGRETLEVEDAHFPDAGGIGVWSKADSQCSIAGIWLEAGPDAK